MFENHGKMAFDKFRGLFDRGREEVCPADFLLVCQNFTFNRESIKMRKGQYQIGYNPTPGSGGAFPVGLSYIADVFKVSGAGIVDKYLVSFADGRMFYTGGVNGYNVPILSKAGWNGEFSAVQIGTRVYIMILDGETVMHVWDVGDPNSTPPRATWSFARIAGGNPPTAAAQLTLEKVPLNPNAPFADQTGIEPGFRIVAILYETNTGFITNFDNHTGVNTGAPGAPVFDGTSAAKITNVTIAVGDVNVVKRHLISTKIINAWDGNIRSPEYFFVADPTKSIENNTSTEIPYINWLDSELVDSADNYIDQLPVIPNARRLTLYNGRLVVVAPKEDRNACYISKIGEPESFDKVNSILKAEPAAVRGIEDVAEHRGNLYIFRDTSTLITQDDDTNPNEWRVITVDKSRGIATGNHDFRPSIAIGQFNHQSVAINGQLLCYSHDGLHTFDGSFGDELTWAIRDKIEKFALGNIKPTIIVNPTAKMIFFGTPYELYMGDYTDGLTAETIKWGLLTFDQFDRVWKPGGLYSLYGDGTQLILGTHIRLFGWNRNAPRLDDTATDENGAIIHAGYVSFELKFPLVYPNDGWIYQFNEFLARMEADPGYPNYTQVILYGLDDFKISEPKFVICDDGHGNIQRRWFNFKGEACSIRLQHSSTTAPFGLEIKNVSISFKQLWAMRPRLGIYSTTAK